MPSQRRSNYRRFYATHIVGSILFLAMGAHHIWWIFLYMIPGLCAYSLDRCSAWVARGRKLEGRLTKLSPSVVRLDLPKAPAHRFGHSANGTRWTYIKVPEVSGDWRALPAPATWPPCEASHQSAVV